MKTKIGVEAVIFRKVRDQKEFLLLHRVLNWTGWEFVKGGVDSGEKPPTAIAREIEEETGIKSIRILEKLPDKKEWTAGDTKYIYDVFVVEVDFSEEVKLNQEVREHDDFKWCTAEEALQLLTYENSKKIFMEALGML